MASNIKIMVIIFVVDAGYNFSLEFLSYKTCLELASIKQIISKVISVFLINLIASINNMSKIDKNTSNN